MTVSADMPHPAAEPDASASEEFSPAWMMDVELTEHLPSVCYDGRHGRVWVLCRLNSEPLGVCVAHLSRDGLTPDQIGALLWSEFSEIITERFASAGLPSPSSLTGDGLEANPAAWPFLQERKAILAAAPFISVVICTRDRPDRLETCLRHLGRQEYPQFEVVVVDNAPATDAVQAVVKALEGEMALRYVPESRPGLSWARNAGISAAFGQIIAFLDDDDEPDRQWLAGLACGFARADDIGCVTGMVLPARLDTPAQELFEQLGGHSKGRGFSSAVFSRQGPQSPLYPLPPFGVGANMAFQREALERIGGFDVALGAGTPAFAGEDTLALTLVLLAGYRIAFEPAALMRHHHRQDLDSLGRQLRGYKVGLTAYYTALLRHRPFVLPALLWLLPRAAGYLRASQLTQIALPTGLQRQQRWCVLAGPVAYMRSARRQARAATLEAGRRE
jgi:GT2 family glycosyltransferase